MLIVDCGFHGNWSKLHEDKISRGSFLHESKKKQRQKNIYKFQKEKKVTDRG